ncbi:MAG: MmcQ/YjbR family DNA-binding protein, partial [Alphaproteobacteria bacterium]|nr:MmcQ/YjbR family DNA-binding protein [Alphaproteobacteria bacterium]
TYDEVTKHLLSLPGAKLSIKWGSDHIFVVGEKMFAGMGPKPKKGEDHGISFKADDLSFELLTKKGGITPARYMAKHKWVSLDKLTRLPDKQLQGYLTRAHAIVAQGLSKKLRAQLGIASD